MVTHLSMNLSCGCLTSLIFPLSLTVFIAASWLYCDVMKPFIIGRSTGRGARRTPQGSRFFCFDIQNFRNVIGSGVHAYPPTRCTPPYRKSWIRQCSCWGILLSLCGKKIPHPSFKWITFAHKRKIMHNCRRCE